MAQADTTVTALASFVGAVDGKDVIVLAGEERAKSDPVVKKFPHLFTAPVGRIEQATAAPGEKRGA